MVATKLKITRLQEEETTNGFYNHGILLKKERKFFQKKYLFDILTFCISKTQTLQAIIIVIISYKLGFGKKNSSIIVKIHKLVLDSGYP